MEEKFEQLINHLDDMLKQENEKLRNMAVNAMSTASGLPFADRAIVESHRNYELMQKRVLGMIDVAEEVKAFSEGYFEKESDK